MGTLQSPSSLPVVGILFDIRTYRHLLYVLIAFPLGFVYSALFSGVVLGAILTVVLVGLIILVTTLLGARVAAGLERWLANRLLDTDLDRYDDVSTDGGGSLGEIRGYLEAASTWRGVGFLSLKFSVAMFALVPLLVLVNGLPLILSPLRYPYTTEVGEVNGEPVTWAIETLPEALLAVAIGVATLVLALHLTNLVAYISRQMAIALLGEHRADGATTEGETAEST